MLHTVKTLFKIFMQPGLWTYLVLFKSLKQVFNILNGNVKKIEHCCLKF